MGMRPTLSKFIIRTIIRPKHKEDDPSEIYSSYDLAKGWFQLKVILKGTLQDVFLISLGIIAAGFGLKGFLLSNGFIDGGAMGITLLIAELTDIPVSILLVLVNLPFLIFGFRVLGSTFVIKTLLAIIGLAFVVAYVPYPEVTHDKLLIAVFGGFFLGTGIGLSIRGGAVIDGTEVLAISLSRRTGLTIGDIILIINVIVFSFAAYLLNVETALYALLTYLAASKTVDFLLEGIEEYTGVTIISVKAEEICRMIVNELNGGVTVYKGERGFGKSGEKHQNMNIVYTVLTRLEISRLKIGVEQIDPRAFIVMTSIKDTTGGMTKKRRHKH